MNPKLPLKIALLAWVLISLAYVSFQYLQRGSQPLSESPLTSPAPSFSPKTPTAMRLYSNGPISFSYPESFTVSEYEIPGSDPSPEPSLTSVTVEKTSAEDTSLQLSWSKNPMSREGGLHPITSAEQAFNAPSNKILFRGHTAYEVVGAQDTETKISRHLAWMDNGTLWRLIIRTDEGSTPEEVAEVRAILDSLVITE